MKIEGLNLHTDIDSTCQNCQIKIDVLYIQRDSMNNKETNILNKTISKCMEQ
jgi:hypothetical protein